jgi:fatty-acyl-CoA synthase
MLFAHTRVADENGRPVISGETGELWLRGQHVSKGFWNQPSATAAAIDGDGWLHTGDLAHCDSEGFFYIDGRIKDMFISGGLNVYPIEIESLLLQHASIEDCAIFAVPDTAWGETGVAAVVRRTGSEVNADEILGFLGPKLARYKLPKSIWFVDSLPRTAYGKVIKPQLVKEYCENKLVPG